MTAHGAPPAYPVAVDLVMLALADGGLQILLIRRGGEPFAGRWALPGGFVEPDEDLVDAAVRELAEETGLHRPAGHLAQLCAYGAPGRDPRGRVVSVAYLALLPDPPAPVAGDDAAAARWWPVAEWERPDATDRLAFDHHRIIADALAHVRGALEHSPLATALCPPEFTLTRLRRVYEAVWGRTLDDHAFRRRVTAIPGFVEPTGRSVDGPDGSEPLYRAGPATLLDPPLPRTGWS